MLMNVVMIFVLMEEFVKIMLVYLYVYVYKDGKVKYVVRVLINGIYRILFLYKFLRWFIINWFNKKKNWNRECGIFFLFWFKNIVFYF